MPLNATTMLETVHFYTTATALKATTFNFAILPENAFFNYYSESNITLLY